MKVVDGRGLHTKKIKKKNIETVKNFFNKNPYATRKQCSEKTGLSVCTIRAHLKYLIGNSSNA